MLGFLNPVSYAKTLETGFVTFWSRTRQKLWMKGETSGNRLRVVSAATDATTTRCCFAWLSKATDSYATRARSVASPNH
jgi:phosphoribosyl-AMP cyclohydrolase